MAIFVKAVCQAYPVTAHEGPSIPGGCFVSFLPLPLSFVAFFRLFLPLFLSFTSSHSASFTHIHLPCPETQSIGRG